MIKKKNILPLAIILVGFLLIAIGVFLFPDSESNDTLNSTSLDSVKKTTYIDTMNEYFRGIEIEVDKAGKYYFYEEDILYLIPVGNDRCYSLGENGSSPFGDKWQYLYMGVTYEGAMYNYFVVALDSENIGIDFVSQSELGDNSVIEKKDLNKLELKLKEIYSSTKLVKYASSSDNEYKSFSEVNGLSDIASFVNRDKIVFLSNCEYLTNDID